ncbi:MAG: DMT family transporter [Selenomonadaceae bacterium]
MDSDVKKETYLLLIFTTIVWGIQPLCIKLLIADWSPVTITCARYVLISGMLFLLMYLRKDKGIKPPRSCWLSLVAMGVTGIFINNVMQFTGLQYSTVTNCTLIASTSPAITAFVAALFIKERLNLLAWLGIIISFMGALSIVSHGSMDMIAKIDFNKGDMLFLGCQIFWTIYSLIALRVMQKMSAMAATAWAGILGAICTACYGLGTDELTPVFLPMLSWAAYFYTVVLGGVMAMLFWNIGVKNAGPSITSIFQNITPIIGMLGGVLIFNEVVSIDECSGALVIFGGVYLTTHSNMMEEYIAHHWLRRA